MVDHTENAVRNFVPTGTDRLDFIEAVAADDVDRLKRLAQRAGVQAWFIRTGATDADRLELIRAIAEALR